MFLFSGLFGYKLLCFRLTTVHLYVIKDNLTDIESAIDVAKEFLTSSEAFAVVSADDAGTPSDHIKGYVS